jgi:hypothetical protein
MTADEFKKKMGIIDRAEETPEKQTEVDAGQPRRGRPPKPEAQGNSQPDITEANQE